MRSRRASLRSRKRRRGRPRWSSSWAPGKTRPWCARAGWSRRRAEAHGNDCRQSRTISEDIMSKESKVIALAAVACLSALIAGNAAVAAEINVVSTAGPMPEVMGALIPMFERASGNKVTIKFQAVPATIKQLKEGAGIDLLI